jgi:hypothetical protein
MKTVWVVYGWYPEEDRDTSACMLALCINEARAQAFEQEHGLRDSWREEQEVLG